MDTDRVHEPAAPQLPLAHLYRPVDPDAGAPWLLVLMHGVGSNEADMFGLADWVPKRYHVLSLRAPNTMGPGSYAWFTFQVARDGHRVIDEAQESASRTLVAQSVADAARQLAVPAERVVVGGFSQGGIMALTLLLTEPALLTAAMAMHSRLLPEVLPVLAPNESLRGKRLWVSHGTQDEVIPLSHAHDIRDRVIQGPIDLTYHEFPGFHEIRPAELSAAMTWLQDLTTGPA